MKRILLLVSAALLAASCGFVGNKDASAELYVPKNTVEFAGNAFTSFSLGADVKLYTAAKPDDNSKWTLQAVVPVRKETNANISGLEIKLTPLDDRSIRVRDGMVLMAEDLADLVPVYNAGNGVERTIVFSIDDETGQKYFSAKEAQELIAKTKGVRMDFNLVGGAPEVKAEEPKTEPEEYPMTLDGQLRKYGIYGKLAQYDKALRNKDKKKAKRIEDEMWAIEKKVKNDYTIPEWLRKSFVKYIEDKEDEIEDRY
jgi:hypothetical protein